MAYPTTATDSHRVRVFGSIFDQVGNIVESAELTTSGVSLLGDCNRNEENSTGDLIGEPRSTTAAVQFKNRSMGDYRLVDNSILTDYFDGSLQVIQSLYSANGYSRLVDNSADNNFGTYDLGGLESYRMDVIFKDNLD